VESVKKGTIEIGDYVELTRSYATRRRRRKGLPLYGVITKWEEFRMKGDHPRPFLIKFNDGTEEWWDHTDFRVLEVFRKG